jgi:hypothetical protein
MKTEREKETEVDFRVIVAQIKKDIEFLIGKVNEMDNAIKQDFMRKSEFLAFKEYEYDPKKRLFEKMIGIVLGAIIVSVLAMIGLKNG